MRRFASLYRDLDASTRTSERVEALVTYFREAEAADAAWALQVLLGKRRRRLITGRRLRQICLQASGLPEWLFEACHNQVGDSAETIALLWPRQADTVPMGRSGPVGAAAAREPAPGDGHVPQPGQGSRVQPTDQGPEPIPAGASEQPLHHWMEHLLPAAAALDGEEQAESVRRLWQGLDPQQLLVASKLLTGGLRVGVAQGLVVRALNRLSGLEEALLQHRLMGEFRPSAAAWNALLAPADDGDAVPSRPYPFFLASPLEPDPQGHGLSPLEGGPQDWLVEWKWDGIRGQLIHRHGGRFLWSRGEELIHDAFPELLEAAASLPVGTVLDGELLVWPPGEPHPASFAQLQRRLGRRRPGRALLAECPVVLVAYDLLEWNGEDIRAWPLSRRRAALEGLLREAPAAAQGPAAGASGPGDVTRDATQAGPPAPQRPLHRLDALAEARLQNLLPATGDAAAATRLRLSPARPLATWEEIEHLRELAVAVNAEGLMLKALASPYRAGRRRGAWWKHKRVPYTLDAVLLYAQAGSGRRANLFTDYTFGLWERPLESPEPPAQAAMASAGSAEPESARGEREEAGSESSGEITGGITGGITGEITGESRDRGTPSGNPPRRLVSFAKAYSGLDDTEILELDRWIRGHTTERFGPVRAVQPHQVFELAFEGLQRSGRHKSGIAVRFPRISRWRRDKPAAEADTLHAALALLEDGPAVVDADRA